MRYGIVRDAPRLAPAAAQRRLLEASGCDIVLEEHEPSNESQHRLFKLLRALKAPDEVIVASLDVFQKPTGELAQLMRDFLNLGVELRIVGDLGQPEALSRLDVTALLGLLAEHEARRPLRAQPTAAAPRPQRRGLTRHQIDYARKLYKDGTSLRQIGLLFRVSPNEVMDLIRS